MTEHLNIEVVPVEECPPDRIFVFGVPARVTAVRVGEPRIEGDRVIIPVERDVEYDPIHTAVIRIDP